MRQRAGAGMAVIRGQPGARGGAVCGAGPWAAASESQAGYQLAHELSRPHGRTNVYLTQNK